MNRHEPERAAMDFEKIIKKAKRRPIVDLSSESLKPVQYGLEEIMKILPNRDPFLLLDEIFGIDLDNACLVGAYHIDENDPVFRGHFPGNPVYPGALQLEMISELFSSLYYFISKHTTAVSEGAPSLLRATRMRDAFFQRGLLPGDHPIIMAKMLDYTPLTFTGMGQILCAGEIVSAVIGDFYIVE